MLAVQNRIMRQEEYCIVKQFVAIKKELLDSFKKEFIIVYSVLTKTIL